MSVPYKIEASQELLVGNSNAQPKASEKIPIIARQYVSDRAKKTLDIVGTGWRIEPDPSNSPHRSRSSSRKNAYRPTRSTPSRLATALSNASLLSRPSSTT